MAVPRSPTYAAGVRSDDEPKDGAVCVAVAGAPRQQPQRARRRAVRTVDPAGVAARCAELQPKHPAVDVLVVARPHPAT
jgi:hypothetical protein